MASLSDITAIGIPHARLEAIQACLCQNTGLNGTLAGDTLQVQSEAGLRAVFQADLAESTTRAEHPTLWQRYQSRCLFSENPDSLITGLVSDTEVLLFYRYGFETMGVRLSIQEKSHDTRWQALADSLETGHPDAFFNRYRAPFSPESETPVRDWVWAETHRERKEKGRFYTPQALALFLAEQVLHRRFHEKCQQIRTLMTRGEAHAAWAVFRELAGLKICDPSVGGGVFLMAAFQILVRLYPQWVKLYQDLISALPPTSAQDECPFLVTPSLENAMAFEEYLLNDCLYGVDLDPHALTLTRDNVGSLGLGGGRLNPQNLGLGNALLSPVLPQSPPDPEWQQSALAVRASGEDTLEVWEALSTPVEDQLFQAHLRSWFPEGDRASIQPFTWGIRFPEVFLNGGFDVILGNPPWEKIKPNQREAGRETGKNLLSTPVEENQADYSQTVAFRKAFRAYLRECGQYAWQGGGSLAPQATSDDNLYKLFIERSHQLLRPGGEAALIVKNGLLGDLGTSGLREALLNQGAFRTLWAFRNKNSRKDGASGGKIFPDVDPNERFLALWFAHPKPEPETELENRPFEVIWASSLSELLNAPPAPVQPYQRLTRGSLRQLSPAYREIPVFTHPMDRTIAEKMQGFPPLGKAPWQTAWGRELDMTLHRKFFQDDYHSNARPLWEGSGIGPLSMAEAPRRWVDAEQLARAQKSFPDSEQSRLVIRLILPNSVRKLNATLVPGGILLGNSLGYLKPGRLSPEETLYLCVLLNSMVCEFWLKQRLSGMTLNFFKLNQLPVPAFSLSPIAERLVETAQALLGVETLHPAGGFSRFQSDLGPGSEVRQVEWIRQEARVALVYGLSRVEWSHVVNAFRVSAKTRDALMHAYLLEAERIS